MSHTARDHIGTENDPKQGEKSHIKLSTGLSHLSSTANP
jgi:hypothetical protein